MKETSEHLKRDGDVLRFVDALDRGDLDSIASLWEKASDDPELESMLLEVEGAVAGKLSEEESIGSSVPRRRHSFASRLALAGALAAACLLAFFVWRLHIAPNRNPSGPSSEQAINPATKDDLLAGRPDGVGRNDKSSLTAFAWPLEERRPIRASSSIPPDLFD